MSSFHFNAVLLDISNQLSAEDLNNLKFLCKEMIGKRQQEHIDTGRKLFQVLTERGKLGADNRQYLYDLLLRIQRQDLCDKLTRFETPAEPTDPQPDDEERAKLDIATEVIAENLGKSWRKLGRKLGLTDVKLESISKRHPTELEETAVELLKEWRKSRGAEARTEELIKALRACQFNLTADKVLSRLENLQTSG
ncbi:FAS-associated death domain protein [Nibea albiflora]|uniref:FAS-associated death domain protein n=1 Tax=Nibea albiflora TaxID=240163 RepID=A0ACB7EFP1_NIBAL|nr:FAS-associated death domain protein [Nibea albiflora]